MTVIFDLMWTITFNITRALGLVSKNDMSLFSAILVLGDTRVHICTLYSGNVVRVEDGGL